MARVDPDDDSIHRWVVWHYRYDSYRSERRNVVVAAFDNPGEFFADIAERSSQLRRRSERGEDVRPAERISGAMYEPGYRACSETLTYSSELSSTESCLHASRSWTCRLTRRPYERSVVLMAPR